MVIKELTTYQKDKFGSGNWHVIYPMKKDPTKVIKVGAKAVIDGWYELFINYPELFPHVYKRGLVPIKLNNEKITANYVIVDKLNTHDFKRIWRAFEGLLLKYYEMTGDKRRTGLQVLFTTIEDNMDIVQKMLSIAKSNKVLYDYFQEFVGLLLQIYEIKPAADIHEDQFGLDAEGKIKCLDL
jgi:hypothetical protein